MPSSTASQRAIGPEVIRNLLEAVDLTRFAKALVGTFSGGMRRRLEIARGLVHSPKVLFLDEPTTGLDPVSRTNVWEMIEKLQHESKLTILLTTHYMDEADNLCNRVAIVDHGKVVALDTPARLKDSVPGNDVVEAEFARAPADWHQSLASLPQAVSVIGAGRRHAHCFAKRARNGGRADGLGQTTRRHRAPGYRAEHDSRRRLFALHRPPASR